MPPTFRCRPTPNCRRILTINSIPFRKRGYSRELEGFVNFSFGQGVLVSNGYFYTMIQQILIIVFFAAAVVYLGIIVYKSFRAQSGCASGCGKCGAIDFKKIEKQLKEKQA